MVTVVEPGVVGVPDSRPAGVSVTPAGSVPLTTEKVCGTLLPIPVNVSICE